MGASAVIFRSKPSKCFNVLSLPYFLRWGIKEKNTERHTCWPSPRMSSLAHTALALLFHLFWDPLPNYLRRVASVTKNHFLKQRHWDLYLHICHQVTTDLCDPSKRTSRGDWPLLSSQILPCWFLFHEVTLHNF